MWIDARIPLRFGPLGTRTPDEAVLTVGPPIPATLHTPGPHTPGPHTPGCPCCQPRNPAAIALGTLFHARATGRHPPFRAVLAPVPGIDEQAVRMALASDPVAAARFRLAD